MHAARHLEQLCNGEGRVSVEASLQEKEEKDVKHTEEISVKQDLFH